ncbi:MAG TPA: head GIN domain-containing protein [Williamwhitmania sp.]|nr:head GIN domain-containing protein [Williamwhitmania sp.]
MKKFIYAGLLCFLCGAIAPQFINGQVAYSRKLADFDKVEVYGDIYMELTPGNSPNIRVEGEGISSDDLVAKVDGQTLVVQLKPRIYDQISVKIYVTYTVLRGIKVGAAANTVCNGTVTGDKVDVEASSSSNLRINLDVTTATLHASLGATIYATGKVGSLEPSAITKGIVAAYGLIADKVFASASLGGIVKVNPQSYLEAKGGTGGAVYYCTKPKEIKTNTSLGGRVDEVPNMDTNPAASDSI